ncbi:YceD family protein [Pseudooceanicola nanhaiensis]|uniref:YceD family protein n=1 Tax=Pseudooceanicola nanhaiensis TaxID=375761 RepID=UPI001CD816B3|nr:YceD family protein [Pseudooceanicola nanhaiensis]MCA0919758.1 DUF177 domain-containing protein [Pseudooceanicola nanhaiensis]
MADADPARPLFTPLRVADLPTSRPTPVEIRPDAAQMARLAEELGLSDLRKVSFTGEVKAEGKRRWRLKGKLGATVVQPCIVTLAPVTTRIEEEVVRRYDPSVEALPEIDDMEMPEDDSVEPLGEVIDPGVVLAEALALALPLYPRAEGAEMEEAQFTEPGKQAMTDEETKPFAGLAALKAKMEKPEE